MNKERKKQETLCSMTLVNENIQKSINKFVIVFDAQ